MVAPQVTVPADGRAARAARTRRAVVEALLALIAEGDLRPTAARIAQRAGVSLRSVFQHFEDMEALLAEASALEISRIQSMRRPLPHSGPPGTRITALVAERSRVYEVTTWLRRAAMLEEPFSAVLQRDAQRMYEVAAREIHAVFGPELAQRPPADRRELATALAVAASWDTWEHLRARCGLSPGAARRVVSRTLGSLLG